MSRRIVQIAWRNLWRNPRRTLVTMAAIALGYAMLLLFACLLEGLQQQMIKNGTSLGLSHMQVHAPAYYPDRSLYDTLGGRGGTDVDRLLAAITADRRVRAASPRVYGYGLAGYEDRSAGVEILGALPAQEQQVTTLHTHLVAGHYLTAQIPQGVVIGDKLADAIGARVGAEVVLLLPAADGSMGNDLYTIVGIFHTGLEAVDRGLVLMLLSALQQLLSLAPDRIHEIGVALADATEATAVAAALEARLGEVLPVRVRAWPELAPHLAEYVRLHRSISFVLFTVVSVLALLGIMNTMLMAVFERTRELGVLMALGVRPVQVVGSILAETGCLVGAGLVLGGGIAAPLLWYLQTHGLDLRSFMGEISVAGSVVDPLWYGRQDFLAYGQAAVGLAATAVLSAGYPAVRAARLRPTEAIRKV
jgi:ABC-type lipoprotein release transport system permease subunit